MKTIGLALGGGGAKGLAHIVMLELLDELGLRPKRIAGTSIGAVMGALYASGISGKGIRQIVRKTVALKGASFKDLLRNKEFRRWLEFLDVDFKGAGLFKGDKIIDFLYEQMGVSTFADLDTPLSVVATDFWSSEQVVLDHGELLPAVKASMGLPGVFTPVVMEDRVLIDGGGVNPVPYDLLDGCDLIIAVDVMGRMQNNGKHQAPGLLRTVLGTFDIMQNSIIREKLKQRPPDIYIKPAITGIDLLDFHLADKIYKQARPAREQLKRELEKHLGRMDG